MEYRENRDVRRPFLATPDARVYFPAAAIERARRTTERCLRRGEGIALVVGATGVGKTILSRVLAASFETDDLTVVATPTRKNTVKSFLQQILFGLRQTYCGCDETELRLMTLDYLARSASRRFVLIVDDAQNLSLPVFDEIRVLVDQGAATAAQISVALIGTNRLEERLNLPVFYPIQQRIAVRSYLEAFEKAEINDYIDGEMRRVGSRIQFSNDAKNLIAELSDGSPRVVNQLSDRALLLAFGGTEPWRDGDWTANGVVGEFAEFKDGIAQIGKDCVERAWANLLNLPEDEKDGDAANALNEDETANVVEFGTLEDDDVFDEYNENGDFNDGEGAQNGDDGAVLVEIRNDAASFTDERRLIEKEKEGEKNDAPIDWEEERYGGFDATRLANASEYDANTVDAFGKNAWTFDQIDEANDEQVDPTEINAELEARLLSKFGGLDDALADVEEDDVEFSDNIDFNGEIEDLTKAAALELRENFEKSDVKSDGGQSRESDGERNAQRQVFEALKSKGVDENDENPEDAERNAAENEFSRLFPKSNTRRALTPNDDGSQEFERVNGFSAEEGIFADESERFWEASLSSDFVSGKAVYSEDEPKKQDENLVGDFGAEANDGDEFVSLEDRAYRQIVDVCRKTLGEFGVGDNFLAELSLLEQEIEKETDSIRRIREIRTRRRDNFQESSLDLKENDDYWDDSKSVFSVQDTK